MKIVTERGKKQKAIETDTAWPLRGLISGYRETSIELVVWHKHPVLRTWNYWTKRFRFQGYL